MKYKAGNACKILTGRQGAESFLEPSISNFLFGSFLENFAHQHCLPSRTMTQENIKSMRERTAVLRRFL
jgi:hypothetical protein